MTKAALNWQSAALQNALYSYGVKVLNVHPGYLQSYIIAGEKWTDPRAIPTDTSADGIYNLILDKRDLDGPMYFSYDGDELPW